MNEINFERDSVVGSCLFYSGDVHIDPCLLARMCKRQKILWWTWLNKMHHVPTTCEDWGLTVRTLLHPRMPHLARLKGFVQYAQLEDGWMARDVPIHLRLLDHGNQRDLFNSDWWIDLRICSLPTCCKYCPAKLWEAELRENPNKRVTGRTIYSLARAEARKHMSNWSIACWKQTGEEAHSWCNKLNYLLNGNSYFLRTWR